MITLKTKKKIIDSTVNRERLVNEIFKVTLERKEQMEATLGKDFPKYFEVTKIEKGTAIKSEKPKTVKRKKGE
ncbi:MAG: hypothetical protein JU82_08805 [Sulfuricurvum sp. MLSB]|uniref:hypothetical protein n=1 Tax=Sulfuricurvum sp. MLSB TaxID=1537917 RepID=UPI000504DE3D|nr:hypothetical protein [Sulfuricurvum sp. MLSB]KFN39027.1 MAG: hypothetical protein JU82_08805 [Sulfuricurvum sp. MLSB]